MALTNSISKVQNFEVKPEILGVNAQTCHKIIQLTLRSKERQEMRENNVLTKLRHCSAEALTRVKREVAKNCKILRLLRGEKPPNIYTYKTIRRIYTNAKVKYIGYRKGRRKQVPVPMAVRTIQAKINETAELIERAKRMKGQNFGKTEQKFFFI